MKIVFDFVPQELEKLITVPTLSQGGNMKNRTVDYHDTTDFAEDYRVVELFDVSSKTGENIENLFDAIINEYVSDPEVRFAEYDRGPIDQYCDRNDIWKKGRRKGSCC